MDKRTSAALQLVVGVVLMVWAVFVFITSTIPAIGFVLLGLGVLATVRGIRNLGGSPSRD